MDWLLAAVPTVILAIVTFASAPLSPPSPQWCVGSVESVGPHHIEIARGPCERDAPRVLHVSYRGKLPAAVCRGSDVYITGRILGGYMDAATIEAFNAGRYDGGCWRSRCLPEGLRPEHCRRDTVFQ